MDENDQEDHVEIMVVCDGCGNAYCSNCLEFADCDNEYEYLEDEDDLQHIEQCDQCI